MPSHNPRITITGSAGNFTATIDPPHKTFRAGHGDHIKWKVGQPADFPADGIVFLQFVTFDFVTGTKTTMPDTGCLVDGPAKGGKHKGQRPSPNDHFVKEDVAVVAPGGYHYEIWYEDSTGPHKLLDPEIVVEGKQDHERKKKKAKKAARKKVKTAKKSNKSKKAKKDRKAKRSMKRKAKKR